MPAISSLDRRRTLDDLLLDLKLAPAGSRPALAAALAELPGLGQGERRQILIAIERYILSPRIDAAERLPQLLQTILALCNSPSLWPLTLNLFKLALDQMRREDILAHFKAPLESLLKQQLPSGSTAVFSPDLFLRVARRLEHAGVEDPIIQLATIGLFFYPFNGQLRDLRADFSMLAGDVGHARADLDRLIEQYPEVDAYRLDRAEASIKLEDFDEALADLEYYVDRHANDAAALRRMADALYQTGRSLEALKVYQRLIEAEPESSENILGRARVNESLDLYEDAAKDLDRVMLLDPSNTEARQLRMSLQVRRQTMGMEDDIYTAFGRGDEDTVVGDLKIPEVRFADLGGLIKIKQTIRETIEYPLKYPEVSERYGKRAGGGLLFFGPPGCGKTMLAKAAAGECGVHFINVNLASVLDKWVGNSEKAISMIFATARKRAPSIIFLDEVDAIGGSRNSMQSGWEKKLISQLLIELDGITSDNDKVMVLGATNAPWDVDLALRRPGRLGQLIFVPPPGRAEREDILRIYVGKKPFVSESIAFGQLAQLTERYSADALRQVVENAAAIPWRQAIETGEERAVSQEDLETAIRETSADLVEWEKLVSRYAEFAQQSLKRPAIGFQRTNPSAT